MQAGAIRAIAAAWIRDHYPPASDAPEITADTDLLETGVLDSIGFVELIEFLGIETGHAIDLFELEPEVFSTLAGLSGAFAAAAARR